MANLPRFFVPQLAAAGGTGGIIGLPEDEAHHAGRVLRLSVGDSVIVFDGQGTCHTARLESLGKRDARCLITGLAPAAPEVPGLALAFALCKGEKPDLILQKAVELGASALIAVEARRSVIHLDAERAGRRMEHWQGITVAACKQCERAKLPVIHGPVRLGELPKLLPGWTFILLEAREDAISLPSLLMNHPGPVCLAVGPEGGWTPEELAEARKLGWPAASLGPRILRAETACIAALAVAASHREGSPA